MASKYLLHFAHEHISFRWPEFLALTSKNNCNFKLISTHAQLKSRPYIIIKLLDESPENLLNLIKSAKASYLLKGLYELWSHSTKTLEHLNEDVRNSVYFKNGLYSSPDQTFRVNCESFNAKLLQKTKIEYIKKLTFMEEFECKPDLSNPKQVYCIFEMNEKEPADGISREYYFGRRITTGDRDAIHKFNLKERNFIANTSMDPMLSLISANIAKVRENDVVYDPFVGSGSLLVAAAYKGAHVLGTDIDWLLLHGRSRSSRKGERARKPGESVRANLEQYNLGSYYIDVLVGDITRSPLRGNLRIDAIIADPPYGVRECSEKVGVRSEPREPKKDYKVRYPAKTAYTMRELFTDLLTLSANHLTVGGRLVYYLPVTTTSGCVEDFIPEHPSFVLITYCEQGLTAKTSRLLVVMEKTRDPRQGDEVKIPKVISDMNFRETYFSKSERESTKD